MKAAVVSDTLRALLPPPAPGAPRPCSTVAGTPDSISRFSAKLHAMLYCRAKSATSGTCRGVSSHEPQHGLATRRRVVGVACYRETLVTPQHATQVVSACQAQLSQATRRGLAAVPAYNCAPHSRSLQILGSGVDNRRLFMATATGADGHRRTGKRTVSRSVPHKVLNCAMSLVQASS